MAKNERFIPPFRAVDACRDPGRPVALIGLTAAGLLAALAASLRGPDAAPPGAPLAALAVRLPDAVGVSVLALSGLLVLALLVPRGVRRRRKGDEDFELYHEPPRGALWLQCALWLVALTPLAVLLAVLWLGGVSPGAVDPSRAPVAGWRAEASLAISGAEPRTVVPMPAYGAVLTAVALLAALAGLGLVVWLWVGDRLAWWWAGSLPGPDRAPLVAAVGESLEDLRHERDPRRAIILCYRHFERVLGASRLPRAPWQTPTEFMRAALGRLALPAGPAHRLTRLFEIARFSERPLGGADRDDALGALTAIHGALQGDRTDGPPA